jgi:hypothetical protein
VVSSVYAESINYFPKSIRRFRLANFPLPVNSTYNLKQYNQKSPWALGRRALLLFSQDCRIVEDKHKIRNFVPVNKRSLEKPREKNKRNTAMYLELFRRASLDWRVGFVKKLLMRQVAEDNYKAVIGKLHG